MKKNLFMVAAVALLALVSCNKEEINNGGVEQPKQPSVIVEFTASLGDQALKTTLSGGKTLWLETDEISINGEVFKVNKLIDGGASASFVNKNELPAGFGAPYTALYPANVTEVPATQNAYAGKFDPTAVLETATSDDTNLSFKNVTSLLKFQVPAACSSVTLTSDDVLAGTNSKEVTISGNMVAGTDYYVAVLPGTKNNFVVRIDGYLSKNAASVNIERSTIANMKTLPAAEASGWCLKGSFDSWGEGYSLFNDLNGNIVAKNIELSGAFKIVNPSDKYVRSISNAPTTSKWLTLYDASGDMSLTGTYDVYVNTANKAICVVTASSSVPEFKLSNRELYVSVQSGWGWPYLYGWEGTNTELWGEWQTRQYDTSLTISNTGYYCWKVPANFNNKTVSLIASKSGEQAPTKSGVALTQDRFYELKYTSKVEFNEVTAPTF